MAPNAPQLTYRNSINMGPGFYVVRLTYSPDGRYLAIGDAASSNIVIWDLKEKREQTRIHVRSNGRMSSNNLHWSTGEDIHWSPDGRYITNGIGKDMPMWDENFVGKMEFWDPMNGRVIKELPVIARTGMTRLSQDGSKLAIHSGQFKDKYSITVYDTTTWKATELDSGSVVIEDITWVAEDKILVVGSALSKGESDFALEDGRRIKSGSTVAKLIDPSGKKSSYTTVLLDPPGLKEPQYHAQVLLSDFLNNRVVAIGADASLMSLDIQSMAKNYHFHQKDSQSAPDGRWGSALSIDGKYLFILNHASKKQTNNIIFDVLNGQSIGQFITENTWGLAVSSDGKTLAIGHESEVLLYDLQ